MSALLGANSVRQAALLIDADNFSDPQAIDAAWAELNAYAGRVSVCRAYGHGPRLQSLWSVWRYLGARTFPNLALEKNTTDAALIADAVALHFQQGVQIFAIASGDADFAPLAARLREWGCEVWCFSMEGIVFRDAQAYYDRVKCFPLQVFTSAPAAPVSVKPAVSPLPVRPLVAGAPASPPVPVPVAPAIPVGPLASTAASTMSEAVGAPGVESFCIVPRQAPAFSRVPLPDEVERILKALPGLREGPLHMAQVVPVLRQHGILSKTTKSTTFLARHSEYFELSPAHQPTLMLFKQPAASAQPEPAFQPLDQNKPAVMAAPSSGSARAVQRILAAFPAWLPDTVRQLGMMDTLLQEGGVQVGGKPLDVLFGMYPDYFKLLPATGPAMKVRLLRKPQGFAPAC
ncbi:MAG: hypothetical protein JWR60_3454 [Polaromonas sp.]|nr:hypothetical protein [Polaromonas sp.]